MDNRREQMVDTANRYSPIITGVASTVIALAIAWGAAMLTQLASDVAVLKSQQELLQKAMETNYSQDDAVRDLGPIRETLNDHANRLDAHSIRLRQVEQKIERHR